MKILLAGDTHGNTGHMKYLISTAKQKGCDRIFQLGDFGYWEHESSGVLYLDGVQKAAERARVTVYFLDGNHDKTSLLLEKYTDTDEEGFILVRPRVRYARRGHVWEWAGKRFIAFGGAYSVDKQYRLDIEEARRKPAGTLWFPEEEMTDKDMRDYLLAAPQTVDFIFAHDKPLMSNPGWNRKDIKECHPNQVRLQEAVDMLKPHLFAHGHLHYRYDDAIDTPHGKTQVLGLDADPWTAERFYRVENSWSVLEVP
jgi:predicted phosphodiesterase